MSFGTQFDFEQLDDIASFHFRTLGPGRVLEVRESLNVSSTRMF